jgi:hypothetical protein
MTVQQTIHYISERHLARRWDVSVRTIERLRKKNVLPYINFGERSIRYPINVIEAYELSNRYLPTTNQTWGLEWQKQY